MRPHPLGPRPGQNNSAVFLAVWWFKPALSGHFSAHNMEGFKLAQIKRITSRSIMKAR
jgi:hypothetical protein